MYFCEIVTNIKSDIIYSLDTGRVFNFLYIKPYIDLPKHPLLSLFTSPLFLLTKIGINPKLLAILIQSLLQSSVICILYNVLFKLTNKISTSLLFSILYGFSNTALIHAIFPEIYVFVGFIQIIFLNYFVYCYQNTTKNLSLKNLFILSILTIISGGINLPNLLIDFLLITFLIVHTYKKQYNKILKDIIKVVGLIFLSIILLIKLQNVYLTNNNVTYELNNVKNPINISKTIKGTFIEPFYSSAKVSYKESNKQLLNGSLIPTSKWQYHTTRNFSYYLTLLFILIPFFKFFINKKIYKDIFIIYSFISIILLYTLFNLIYDSNECFLYASNYFSMLIILLCILYQNFKQKYTKYFIIFFIIYELIQNIYNLFELHEFLIEYYNDSHVMLYCMFIASIITFIFLILLNILKKISKNKIKDPYLFSIFIYSYIIFISIILIIIIC